MRPRMLLTAIVVTAAACAPVLSSTPIQGAASDLSAIAGRWTGDYVSPEAGRSGSIVFTFVADKNKAYGDVAMGRPRLNPNLTAGGDPAPVSGSLESQLLKFKLVNVINGDVFGVLEPYTDPSCDCTVRTTFTGHIDDPGTIRGTFATTGPRNVPSRTGTWVVTKH
jgi:hypothetical protein